MSLRDETRTTFVALSMQLFHVAIPAQLYFPHRLVAGHRSSSQWQSRKRRSFFRETSFVHEATWFLQLLPSDIGSGAADHRRLPATPLQLFHCPLPRPHQQRKLHPQPCFPLHRQEQFSHPSSFLLTSSTLLIEELYLACSGF